MMDRAEIMARAADGLSLSETAREIGVGRHSLRRWANRNGVAFVPRGGRPIFSPRRAVEDMKPVDAVAFLLEMIEAMQGYGTDVGVFPGHPLTEAQRVLFSVLVQREGTVVPRERVYDVMYSSRPVCNQPEIKVLDVLICKIRAALAGIEGFRIATVRSVGWQLERDEGYRFPWEPEVMEARNERVGAYD